MWRNVGITRDADGLAEAAEQVDFWCRYALRPGLRRPRRLDPPEHAHRRPADDRRRLAREESRGVHTRSDFPATDPGLGPPHRARPPAARATELPSPSHAAVIGSVSRRGSGPFFR